MRKELIFAGLSTIAQGTRELFKITSFTISVGIQLLATIGKTKRTE